MINTVLWANTATTQNTTDFKINDSLDNSKHNQTMMNK